MKVLEIFICAFVGWIIATVATVGAWHIQIEPRAFQCWDSIGIFDTYWQNIDEHSQAGDKLSPGWTWDEIKSARQVYIWAFYGIWGASLIGLQTVYRRSPPVQDQAE